jgi:peptidoglycan-associated lipoprotein
MRPVIQLVSLVGILSLSLAGLTGCGEKRIHVATLSGTPGEEAGSSTSNTGSLETSSTPGLPGSSVEESSLMAQDTPQEEVRVEAVQPTLPAEPMAFANEPSMPATINEPSMPTAIDESGMRESLPQSSTEISSEVGSGLTGDADSLVPSANGKDIATQSSSLAMNGASGEQGDTSPFTASAAFQDDLSGPQTAGMETIPESFQVAKAEPSDMLQQQLDKIKEEELATAAAGLEDVFFQFDSWTLTAEAKESLERDLGWLKSAPSSLLVIEGHADQRGTQAYNMVLGKKRAMAIHDYLSELGVDPSRLSIISYGKDKPFCQDQTEVCHQLNRRGHLLVQN